MDAIAVSLAKLIRFCPFRCLQALQAMHQAGLQHGDLHEGNVLYAEAEDSVYLTDFGLSRRAHLYRCCSRLASVAHALRLSPPASYTP